MRGTLSRDIRQQLTIALRVSYLAPLYGIAYPEYTLYETMGTFRGYGGSQDTHG